MEVADLLDLLASRDEAVVLAFCAGRLSTPPGPDYLVVQEEQRKF
jgi:hypothetical protein